MAYSASDPKEWNGRTSVEKEYIYQRIECITLNEIPPVSTPSFGILGYAVDEGVRRNQGRIGASMGPNAFRNSFAKLSDHISKNINLYDVGTLICEKADLEQTQEELSDSVYKLLKKGVTPLVIGGGHDIAYGHYKGIQRANPDKKIGIINFDAHLDLRPFETGSHSGSPFNQINYLCVGFRKESNPPSLLKRAEELKVKIIDRSISNLQHIDQVTQSIDSYLNSLDIIYITIDLDGFADTYAPGVSAASPHGFNVDFALACLKHIVSSKKVISVDIAELNPSYDIDSRTSKLAAGLAYHIIDQWA